MCLYAADSMVLSEIKAMGLGDFYTCKNENSPYYDEIVDKDKVCRLFVDEKKYFKMRDREEAIDKVKRNIKGI